MRTLFLFCASLAVSGCATSNFATVTSKSSVGRCLDRLMEKSRAAGYAEVAMEKEIAYFRVASKAVVNQGIFFGVQCQGDERALISVVDDRGLFDDKRPLNDKLADELDTYRRKLDGY